MKKIIVLLSVLLLLFTGCGKYSEKDVIKDFQKKITNLDSYMIDGELEILSNDEMYKYDIEVSYEKDNNYKVSLTNKANEHTQIILKNGDGVYV